ncbi:uncharacterized protein BJ212DRAFT_1402656, partial [Suillus subaureus]
TNAPCFPILSHITLDYLPVQGSLVPYMKWCARLLPKNFGDIQMVKGKYKWE